MRTVLTLTALLLILTLADANALPDGTEMSKQIYCDVKNLFSGKLGLLAGFCVALYGLMQIIQGSTGVGLMFILGGAAVTMLPSLIESFMGGVSGALGSISTGGGFNAPEKCSNPKPNTNPVAPEIP